MALTYSAWPSRNGSFCAVQRSASQYQLKVDSQPMMRSLLRNGARARRNASGFLVSSSCGVAFCQLDQRRRRALSWRGDRYRSRIRAVVCRISSCSFLSEAEPRISRQLADLQDYGIERIGLVRSLWQGHDEYQSLGCRGNCAP